jgi:phosphodiesterase/alkaline phosphatase D-like protein
MYKESWLGPFLMKPTTSSMGFWLCSDEESSFSIKVAGQNYPMILNHSFGNYHIYTLEVHGFSPNTKIKYKFLLEDQEITPAGLHADDLCFRTLPSDDMEFSFVLMSCHGVEEYEKKHSEDGVPLHMFKRLNEMLDKSESCYLAVLGGDQVYMDDTFEGKVDKFKGTKEEKIKILEVYHKYWKGLEYRKVFARLPALLMWDDHDLIDGFGSREDSFNKKELAPSWKIYQETQAEAFYSFQSIRNSSMIKLHYNHSYLFKHQDFAILGLDLRSERNVKKGLMMSEQSWGEIEASIANLKDIRTLFINTPVTIARMGGALEQQIGRFSSYFWNIFSGIAHGEHWGKPVLWALLAFVTLIVSQAESPIPKFYQYLLSFIFCFFLVIKSLFGEKVFEGKMRIFLRIFFSITGALALGGICWEVYHSGNLSTAFNGFCQQASRLVREYFMLPLVLYSLSLCFWKIREKKLVKFLNLAALAIFIILVIWSGSPDQELHFNTIFIMLPLIISMLIPVLFIILASLEFLGAIDTVAGLDDDLKDGWSSEENSEELHRLLNLIQKTLKAGVKVVVLSGDIHTGGLTELCMDDGGEVVYQVTSSPITYPPMPAIAEKLTSGINPISLPTKASVATARNLFFISKRNFVLLTKKGAEVKAEFFFEDYNETFKVEL